MDFELSETQKMIQTTVRRFVNEELMPLEREVMGKTQSGVGYRMLIGKEKLSALEEKAKDIGLWALFVPEGYGGAGLGTVEFCVITEELSRALIRFDFGGDAPGVLLEGNEAMRENYYLPCVRGGKYFCFAQTEPNAGSDAAALETTAVKQRNGWVINGTKTFITNAESSDFALVMTVTDKSKGHHGITMFVVDRKTDSRPGYEVTRMIQTLAEHSTCEIVLDNCLVPFDNIVGKEGEGFKLAQKYLEVRGRLHHAAQNLGIARRCLDMAIDYAQQRVTFGKPLAERQAIQWMLADSAIEMHASRWMTYHCAWAADRGENIRAYAAITKTYSDEMVNRVVDRAIQIHGGSGCTADLPLEKFYRRARIWKVGGGSMEMMRRLIARQLFQGFRP